MTYYIFNPAGGQIFETPSGKEAVMKWKELEALCAPTPTHVIAVKVDPRMLFEQFIVSNSRVVPPRELPSAKENPNSRIGRPGQFAPMRRPGFVPVQIPAGRSMNDCAIVAAANVFGISYREAKVLCFQYGWSSTKGIPRGFLEVLLSAKKFVPLFRPDLCGMPLSELRCRSPLGIYLVYVAGHVMPMVEETLCNTAGTEWQSVDEVYEVQPLSVVEEAEALQNRDNVV